MTRLLLLSDFYTEETPLTVAAVECILDEKTVACSFYKKNLTVFAEVRLTVVYVMR